MTFKLFDKVYLHGHKDETWKIVSFSEKHFCYYDGLPMTQVISNGKMTYVKQREMSLVK